MALLRSAVNSGNNICAACRTRLLSGRLSAAGREWTTVARRFVSKHSPAEGAAAAPEVATTNSASRTANQARANALKESFKGPVVLFQLRRDRFKFYYIGLVMGLIPIPLWYNEKKIIEGRLRMAARRQARANILNEPLPKEGLVTGKYDGILLKTFFMLAITTTTLVVMLSVRVVTRWQYDFKAKMHTITTFSPYMKQRTFSVADSQVIRLADYRNRARIRIKKRPMAFMLDLSGGSKPNVQLYNIVLGSGHGSS